MGRNRRRRHACQWLRGTRAGQERRQVVSGASGVTGSDAIDSQGFEHRPLPRLANGGRTTAVYQGRRGASHNPVEAMGLEPTNLLTASQALYQLSYAPVVGVKIIRA